jgi:hypothetical protein
MPAMTLESARCFLGSRFGFVAMLLLAIAVAYLLWTHTGHALAAAPFLIILLCPLIHLFGHGHGHGKH